MSGNIYVTGFMGCGKSTVAKELAAKLSRQYVEMDMLLIERLGMSIAEYFAKEGEDSFRQVETLLLKELANQEMLVVSTGGGIVENRCNRRVMEGSGTVLFLDASLNECIKRVGKEGAKHRPLWQDKKKLKKLFESRTSLYAEADIKVCTDSLSVNSVVDTAINKIYPEDNFSVRMDGVDCPVVCSFSPLDAIHSAILGRKIAILTDKNVAPLYIPEYQKMLPNALVIELSGGEKIKTLKNAKKIYSLLLENHFNRDDYLLALGGGTVTDLGAFVAVTYKRGMKFMLISTTLLGCVDAAIGGKAAVNLDSAKNIIGSFTIPELVVLDAGAFSTLNKKYIADGLIEAYKTGLIDNQRIAAIIENNYDKMLSGDLPLLKDVASLSAQVKARVVSKDFRETGLRAILNFGHTYGHAIEGFYNYKLSHGVSVAMGMLVALVISRKRKYISEVEFEVIVKTIRAICSQFPEFPDHDVAMEIMSHDKKIRSGKIIFILLKSVG